ncbi:MAG: response regulator [Actinobacteria bacterium]|nr:response regulator [Actinomycetota bacterium]
MREPAASEVTILIVDDDEDIRAYLEVTLTLSGYQVIQATDGEEGVRRAAEDQPDLILMDVMMPNLDGFDALRRIRADGRTRHLPVIVLTAKAQADDKVMGFTEGADDYVTKPFDPDELIARVEASLRRAREMRSVSPLTGLPANNRIERELARRIEERGPFALLYADLNQFKAYNDHYGFMRGDLVLQATARLVVSVAGTSGDPDVFVGHVGGDDFVVITTPDEAERIASEICARFDAAAPAFYDPEDLASGHIEVADRRGNVTRFGLLSISIGIAVDREAAFTHPTEAVGVATEMKSFAKRSTTGSSNCAIDRRLEANRQGAGGAPTSGMTGGSGALAPDAGSGSPSTLG